jgi:hypothetical protein
MRRPATSRSHVECCKYGREAQGGKTGVKQISTVTYGIDLGDEYSQLCVLDDDGEVVEEGRIRTSEEALRTGSRRGSAGW